MCDGSGGLGWRLGLGVSGGVLLVCTPLHLATTYVWAKLLFTRRLCGSSEPGVYGLVFAWSLAWLVLRF